MIIYINFLLRNALGEKNTLIFTFKDCELFFLIIFNKLNVNIF